MELPFKTYRQHVEAAVAAFLPAVKQRAVSGINGPAYLYCRHAKPNQEGELKLFLEGETPDPRWELVTGEGLRSHIPYDHYFTWVEHRARIRRGDLWSGDRLRSRVRQETGRRIEDLDRN
ncbi:MAG: hypothetical protein LW865_02190 [Betaproteobacteria bacterium]|jgi:hypothetical protein|nr:hypothetical protein [Betaproteobacteria bacterium]